MRESIKLFLIFASKKVCASVCKESLRFYLRRESTGSFCGYVYDEAVTQVILNISNNYLVFVPFQTVRLCFCVRQVPDLDCVVVRRCGEDSLVFRRTKIYKLSHLIYANLDETI